MTRSGSGGRRFSLRFQLVAILLLCYLIPTLVLGLFAHAVLLRSLRDRVETALKSDTAYAWNMTVRNLDRAVTLGKEAVYDEDLATAWGQWRSAAVSDAEYLRLSRNYLERKFGRDSLFAFAVFLPAGADKLVISNPSGRSAMTDFVAQDLDGILRAAEGLDTRGLFLGEGERLCLVRNLLNLRMERIGTLVLGLRADTLLAPVLELKDRWQAGMALQLDRYEIGGESPGWEQLQSGLTDLPGEKTIRYVQTAEEGDYILRLMLTLDRETQYREVYTFQRLSALLILLLLPILALILYYLHRRIIRPIRLLADASRRIEAGELGVTVPMRGGDELGDLGVAFSDMSLRLRDLIEKTYQEEIALKNAQIQALQSRINPHFLNNALETINWEARMEGSETISAMVSALSVLLNASLGRKNRRLVPLREELEVADAYIFFIQQRYEDALTVTREIDAEAETCPVPLLTVQPVLENAVEHGIAPAGGGEIRIRAAREGAFLRLEICNTGRPVREEDRERIDRALAGDTAEGEHLGLANIAHRLRLLYGSDAAITVRSEEGETRVLLLIPAQETGSDMKGEVP